MERRVFSLVASVIAVGLAAAAVGARASTPGEPGPTQVPTQALVQLQELPPFLILDSSRGEIARLGDAHTIIPSRPRTGLLQYQVQRGDSLFGIAEKFGLKPESILWGNWYELGGDPHSLQPGQDLFILPIDGVLHRWTEGEGLNGVAEFYGVTAQDIIDWPGNELDPNIDPARPGLAAGTDLIVPGGRREAPSWQQVRITRANPLVASILGPGACSAVSGGSVGDAVFD